MSTSDPSSAAWLSCWPTADETTVSLSCPLAGGGPWLAARALDVMRTRPGVGQDPGRERFALGDRRRAPLVLGEPLLWSGLPVTIEAWEAQDWPLGEVTLRLPPWEQLQERVAEDDLWELTDRLCIEVNARCGVLSDGRTVGHPDLAHPARALRQLQRLHLGVLVPPIWLDWLRPGSNPYRALEASGMVVVLE